MIKALFFDFYGTIVHEDGVVIDEIPYILCHSLSRIKSNYEYAKWNEMDWDNTRYISYVVYDFADAGC